MEVTSIEADPERLAEILKQTGAVEEIVLGSEVGEGCEEEEIEEIVEIIEEIEEIEETEEVQVSEELENSNVNKEVHPEEEILETESQIATQEVLDVSHDFRGHPKKPLKSYSSNDSGKTKKKKQAVTYDVDEDWEDDEPEHEPRHRISKIKPPGRKSREQTSESSTSGKRQTHVSVDEDGNEYWRVRDDDQEPESILGYEDDLNCVRNVQKVNSHHEIVKNEENNLVYTVLGSKKQGNAPRGQEDRYDAARYIKMEQLEESTIPVEGTVYYDGDDMETLYVAQQVTENEEYQHNNTGEDEQEQEWDGMEQDNSTQDAEEDREENQQEQIFLHEDEDGQLYFKDDSGKLQPVYLTPDGNYAIAENPIEETENHNHSQAHGGSSSRQSEGVSSDGTGLDFSAGATSKTALVPASAIQEMDNEDNTVTISLIISEDENGQKRTQVIIPTIDNLKCETCNKTFKTTFQLLRHNRLKHAREEEHSTRNYPCDLCSKRYPDPNSLVRHRKTHNGDRPFQCLECHKSYPTSTALRRHLTLHNPQTRPLPCIYCGRRFLDKSSLAKHEQSHMAGDQRTHSCDICHKAFLHAGDLNLHKKNHDPERKFDCEVCGREFNRLNNLQRHMMVHQQVGRQSTSEEVLACDVCGITYKFMSSLTRHMVTTHMNPEKMRQQAEEQRRKRENNYRRYMENRKMYETQNVPMAYGGKRGYHLAGMTSRMSSDNEDEMA